MNISEIKKKLFTQKTTDYSFTMLFLIIFSVFIVFAIKPSLTTAFSLKKEQLDLTKIDKVYEDKIMSIALVQSKMEQNRNDIPLIYQAISTSPQVNKMVDDIKQIADANSFLIMKASIGEVNLFESKKTSIQTIGITVVGVSDFEHLSQFISALLNQRRLKTINNLKVSRPQEEGIATESGQLQIQIDVEGYYL